MQLLDSLPGEVIPDKATPKPVEEVVAEEAAADVVDKPNEQIDAKYLEPNGELIDNTDEPPLVNGDKDEAIPIADEEIVEEATPQADDASVDSSPEIEEGLAIARYTFKAETDNELSFRKVGQNN